MFKKFKFLGLALLLSLAVILVACGEDNNNNGSSEDPNNNNNNNGEDGIQLGETDLTVTYVAWAGELLRTPMVKLVLEEAGYNVDDMQVEAGAMWGSVADGSADFMTGSWLPATHKSYWEEFGDDVIL